MITIKLCSGDNDPAAPGNNEVETVKGRVHVYDDSTKVLILKVWSDEKQKYTGLGVYNTANIILDKIHVLQDLEVENEQLENL